MTEPGSISHAADPDGTPLLLRGKPSHNTTGLKKPSLAARLCALQGDAKNPAKSGFNTHHQYAYVTAADALDALRPLLAKHGVAVFPPSMVREDDIQGSTRAGGSKSQAHLTLAYRIESADDPADYVEVVWAARANDTDGDKGIYKALTNAQKYLMFALGLVSGEDQDNVEDDTGWAPRQGQDGGGQQGRGAGRPSPRAQPKAGSKRRKGWPSASGDSLGVPFIAEARKRLKTANRTLDDLRGSIANAGQGDKVQAEDPATWPADLRDGIIKWVDQAVQRAKGTTPPADKPKDKPADNPPADDPAPDPAGEPGTPDDDPTPKASDRPAWPVDDKPKPGQVGYWRAKLLTQAEAALAKIVEDKGGDYQPVMDAEQLVRSAELADDSGLLLPDQEAAEGKAVKSYKDLVTAVDKGERNLGTWYVPF